MKSKSENLAYYTNNAASFDAQRAKLAPMKDALHLGMRLILSELPDDANVLCVGVGTGPELLYLAEAFPQWRFTAVDPSSAMLDVCQERVEEAGIASRCTFHEGYLESLPDSDPFDAATSILVSHFIAEGEKRSKYYTEIAARLRRGGYMINADLAADMASSEYKSLLDIWVRMHNYSGMAAGGGSVGRNLALRSPGKVASILKSSGFESPVLFFQTLLIHAWFSTVRP